jgi:DNA-directed RNA polymerase subunit beta'
MDRDLEMAGQSSQGEELERNRMKIFGRYAQELEKSTIAAAMAQGNNLANTVVSGARGSTVQLRGMLTTPAMYTDYRGRVIPRFVRNSFGEGVRPADYLAGAFGVRLSVMSTKNATADAGDLGKQLVQSASNLVVTQDDCGSTNGISVSPDDEDTLGRVLARDVDGVKAGTVIDRHVAQHLRQKHIKNIIARSAMTCQAEHGICSHCLGRQAGGKFAPIGYAAGITAAQAIAEPLTQGALSTKHEAGAFKGERRTFAGFNIINQIMQSPETFPHRAAVAELEGKVDKVEDAPQGGKFITVAGQKHYALPGYEPLVKPGDVVEKGDQLSDGIVDVNDVVRLRGLGEGRRYYVDRVKQALSDSGAGTASRRNLELVARGALDHIRVTADEGVGNYLPDDIGSYNHLSVTYSPPADLKQTNVHKAVGQFLHAPALHYTIGTQLTGRMAKELDQAGVQDVTAGPVAPPFVPEMVRLRGSQSSGTDWLAKFHTSNLGRNVGLDAERARDTNLKKNVHFVPRLAAGEGFGENVSQHGEF